MCDSQNKPFLFMNIYNDDREEKGEYNKFWAACESLCSSFEKRAKGELPEMESSKSVARLVNKLAGGRQLSLLDAGCGTGHYYVSLQRKAPQVAYTGCDVTASYIEKAQEIWKGKPVTFRQAEIGKLPYTDHSFDFVLCSNVLLHIPPPVFSAIKDLIRVAREVTIIRTPVADRSYFIKEVRDYGQEMKNNADEQMDVRYLDEQHAPFNHFNLYENRHLQGMIKKAAEELGISVEIEFQRDVDFKPFNNTQETSSRTATRVMDGKQISGSILLDWYYIIVRQRHHE